jgi:hypothetical protein
VAKQFHNVTNDLSHTLDVLPYSKLDISDEVQEQVFNVFTCLLHFCMVLKLLGLLLCTSELCSPVLSYVLP